MVRTDCTFNFHAESQKNCGKIADTNYSLPCTPWRVDFGFWKCNRWPTSHLSPPPLSVWQTFFLLPKKIKKNTQTIQNQKNTKKVCALQLNPLIILHPSIIETGITPQMSVRCRCPKKGVPRDPEIYPRESFRWQRSKRSIFFQNVNWE